MEVWLVRHAEVAAAGRCYGQIEVPVALDAAEAAARIANALPATPAEVWSSPWARAREPAERLAGFFGVPLRVDPRLSELSMGAFEGRPFAELENEAAFRRWMERWRTTAPPGGETAAQLSARAEAWLRERRGPGALLAVTHAGVIRALRAHARGGDLAEAMAEPVPHLTPERLPAAKGARGAAQSVR